MEGDLLLEAQPTGAASDSPWRPLYRFDRGRQ
jgi:hypothetical protein